MPRPTIIRPEPSIGYTRTVNGVTEVYCSDGIWRSWLEDSDGTIPNPTLGDASALTSVPASNGESVREPVTILAEATPFNAGTWTQAYTSAYAIVPTSSLISMNLTCCPVCDKPIKTTDKVKSVSWDKVVHAKCYMKSPRCRECKGIVLIREQVTHPHNPRFKYHKGCCHQYTKADGEPGFYHKSWKLTDHLGNDFTPNKDGVAMYRTGTGSKRVERLVGIKTMMKLKKAGIIKRASIDLVPESWGYGNVDYIGDANEPKFIDSTGKKHASASVDPNGYEYVGCELEVERGELFKAKLLNKKQRDRIHASVSDGSIRGVEVLTMPSAGKQFIETAKIVTDALSSMGWEGTSACGAHAHVNFRNTASSRIKRAMLLAYKMEPFILDRCDASRRTNSYCRRLSSAWDLQQIQDTDSLSVDELIYGTDDRDEIEGNKEDKYCDARYAGVNFHSIYYRGTLEFRYLEGTTDAKKLACFGLLYAGIVEQCQKPDGWLEFWEKAKSLEPEQIIELMNTPSIKLLKRLSPTFIR